MLKAPDLRPLLPVRAGTARRRRATPRIADPRAQRARGSRSAAVHPGTASRRQGNADLWAVLPVGPGTAARRAAAAQTPTGRMAPFSARTPQGQDGAQRSAGLRPASRGSAKPAPMTPGPANVSPAPHPPASCGSTGERTACCQRQQELERRSPTGIARERETCTAGIDRPRPTKVSPSTLTWGVHRASPTAPPPPTRYPRP